MNYKSRHKSISTNLTIEEYQQLREITDAPSTYIRQLVRESLAEKRETAGETRGMG